MQQTFVKNSYNEQICMGLQRFRRFGEQYSVIQAESELTLINQWLKTTYMRTTSYPLLVSKHLLLPNNL